jgi:hypothetical protein
MMLYRRVELTEGQPVQFVGIYATRWPYDSGVEPTVGFIEVDTEVTPESVIDTSEIEAVIQQAADDEHVSPERIAAARKQLNVLLDALAAQS